MYPYRQKSIVAPIQIGASKKTAEHAAEKNWATAIYKTFFKLTSNYISSRMSAQE